LVGEGLGGAVVSGYGGSELGENSLTVQNSTFSHNDALGGDNNCGTASVSGLVGTGTGGGIANYAGGTADISDSTLAHNRALGGRGNTVGGTGALFAGLGAGGALFNYLGNYTSPPQDFGPLGPSVVTLTGCTLDHNQAKGSGGSNGEGGAIADLLSATTTVDRSTLSHNEADSDGGGAGLGGGAYNDATSSLALTHSLVTKNAANGSPGEGGGVYNLGTLTVDIFTIIEHNHASTSNDDVFP
jgi:hypothetical protein